MNNRKIITVTLVLLAVIGLAVMWWFERKISIHPYSPNNPPKVINPEESPNLKDALKETIAPKETAKFNKPLSTTETNHSQKPKLDENGNAQHSEKKMGDLEFNRLRMTLPAPINLPWKGNFIDSNSCFENDKKLTSIEVLPTWIRKALKEGMADLGARYLWSLTKLADDRSQKVATEAVLAIFRLGDVEDFAITRMKSWITEGTSYSTYDASLGKNDYVDIRERVLRELSFYGERKLDEVIYSIWQKNKSIEGNNLNHVDFAYYLEKHGRDLPTDYWLLRLDNPYGFANALEVAQKKDASLVTAKLQTLYNELHTKSPASIDAGRAASIASVLFRQTGDTRYRDYLVEQAQIQIASGSFESSLPKILAGLAAMNDKASLEVVSIAMKHQNAVIREMAIDALGKTSDPAATEILYEAAIQKAKVGKGFPAREMGALLAQNDSSADSKYEQLQQALLGGQFGWSATMSDFDTLEFFRKHCR